MTKDKVRSTEEALSTVRALKLALEKFEFMNHVDSIFHGEFDKEITAIKEALAQPEHDKTDVRCECCGYMTYHREHLGCIRAAKLKEPEQDPLTDEDLELLKRALRFYEGCPDGQYDELVVELIHDRLAQPEQEPVAWIYEFYADMGHKGLAFEEQHSAYNTPLYTTPPSVAKPHKRPSRSDIKPLTDAEIILIVADCASSHQHTDIHFARAIEAKLKEKNT